MLQKSASSRVISGTCERGKKTHLKYGFLQILKFLPKKEGCNIWNSFLRGELTLSELLQNNKDFLFFVLFFIPELKDLMATETVRISYIVKRFHCYFMVCFLFQRCMLIGHIIKIKWYGAYHLKLHLWTLWCIFIMLYFYQTLNLNIFLTNRSLHLEKELHLEHFCYLSASLTDEIRYWGKQNIF